jgi:hypothetical protein
VAHEPGVSEGKLDRTQIAELESHVLDCVDDFDQATLTDEEKLLLAFHRVGRPGGSAATPA